MEMGDEKKKPHYTDPGQPGHEDWIKQYGPGYQKQKLKEKEEASSSEEPDVDQL